MNLLKNFAIKFGSVDQMVEIREILKILGYTPINSFANDTNNSDNYNCVACSDRESYNFSRDLLGDSDTRNIFLSIDDFLKEFFKCSMPNPLPTNWLVRLKDEQEKIYMDKILDSMGFNRPIDSYESNLFFTSCEIINNCYCDISDCERNQKQTTKNFDSPKDLIKWMMDTQQETQSKDIQYRIEKLPQHTINKINSESWSINCDDTNFKSLLLKLQKLGFDIEGNLFNTTDPYTFRRNYCKIGLYNGKVCGLSHSFQGRRKFAAFHEFMDWIKDLDKKEPTTSVATKGGFAGLLEWEIVGDKLRFTYQCESISHGFEENYKFGIYNNIAVGIWGVPAYYASSKVVYLRGSNKAYDSHEVIYDEDMLKALDLFCVDQIEKQLLGKTHTNNVDSWTIEKNLDNNFYNICFRGSSVFSGYYKLDIFKVHKELLASKYVDSVTPPSPAIMKSVSKSSELPTDWSIECDDGRFVEYRDKLMGMGYQTHDFIIVATNMNHHNYITNRKGEDKFLRTDKSSTNHNFKTIEEFEKWVANYKKVEVPLKGIFNIPYGIITNPIYFSDIIWGPEIDCEGNRIRFYCNIIPPTEKYLGNEKYKPLIDNIYNGLGIPTSTPTSPSPQAKIGGYKGLLEWQIEGTSLQITYQDESITAKQRTSLYLGFFNGKNIHSCIGPLYGIEFDNVYIRGFDTSRDNNKVECGKNLPHVVKALELMCDKEIEKQLMGKTHESNICTWTFSKHLDSNYYCATVKYKNNGIIVHEKPFEKYKIFDLHKHYLGLGDIWASSIYVGYPSPKEVAENICKLINKKHSSTFIDRFSKTIMETSSKIARAIDKIASLIN